MKGFSFPVVTKIELKNFSLYRKKSEIVINISKGVFCLAGANGLGKSTFITTLNYGLTGIVKHPERNFSWYNEIVKFYSDSKGFVREYFDGRIDEDDRGLAEITIHFKVNDIQYKITRGFFEPDELREFERKDGLQIVKFHEDYAFDELNEEYKKYLTKDIGLSRFEQFVFLQLFVFTFDETHELLFWNQRLIEPTLYLAFGADPTKAELADKLRKQYSKHDSDFRNLQYQITRTRNDKNKLISQIESSSDLPDDYSKDIVEKYKDLLNKQEEINLLIQKNSNSLNEVNLNISDNYLKISSLKTEYDDLFSSFQGDIPIEKNPNIVDVLNDLKIKIFTDKDYSSLLDKLVSLIKDLKSHSLQASKDEVVSKLRIVDENLTKHNKTAKDLQLKKQRLLDEGNVHSLKLIEIGKQISEIEEDNKEIIDKSSAPNLSSDKLSIVLDNYDEAIKQAEKKKQEAKVKRDDRRKELDKLEKELNEKYYIAQSEFLPIFNGYARSFIGLDLNAEITFTSKAVSLSLIVNGQKRDEAFKLSESQRYFIDIALRMALVDIFSNNSILLIDTPEGSLDIAYESTAGKMFAGFAEKKHNLLLTANINSSQLLLELATTCKAANMQIERMTSWTTLSDIQQQEENKIELAFSQIEKALAS